MSNDDDSPNSGQGSHRRLDLWTKLVLPVAVVVIGALVVAVLTPAGESLRELLFPTKVTVIGNVSIPLQSFKGATVKIDGEERGTFEGNRFSLPNVRAGDHELQLEAVGAKPKTYHLTVKRNEPSPKNVGTIELEPLLALQYSVEETLPANPFVYHGPPPWHYKLFLWLQGDRAAIEQIASVTYTLPEPLSGTVQGKRPNEFCYAQSGQISFQEKLTQPFASLASAQIRLQNGDRYSVGAVLIENVPHPNCPIKNATKPPNDNGVVTGSWTGSLGGLSVEVTRVKNQDGHLSIQATVTNHTNDSVTFGYGATAVDESHRLYKEDVFSNWPTEVASGQTITSTIDFDGSYHPGDGTLNLTFASLIGFDLPFDGSLTVAGIKRP